MKKLLLLLLFIPLVGFGQGILKGYTIDFAESPLPGASIYNTTNKKSSISNKVGYFIINASVGDIIKVRFLSADTDPDVPVGSNTERSGFYLIQSVRHIFGIERHNAVVFISKVAETDIVDQ